MLHKNLNKSNSNQKETADFDIYLFNYKSIENIYQNHFLNAIFRARNAFHVYTP